MEGIKEAVNRIAELGAAEKKLNVFNLTHLGEPQHIYAVVKADGALEYHEAKPSPRKYTVDDVPSLAALSTRFGTEAGQLCFINGFSAVLYTNESGDRRESVTMNVPTTPQYKTVCGLSSKGWLEQKAMRRLLFDELRNIEMSADLFTLVKSLRLSTENTTGGQYAAGSESVAASVKRAAISDGADIPEEVTLSFHVLEADRPDHTENVRCLFEIDYEQRKMRLIPTAGELDRINRDASLRIRDSLKEELPNVEIVCGRP